MKKKYKFSIITPVFNSGKCLQKLVDSLEKQTYEKYELLLIDDGSVDDSFAQMKKLEENNDYIKIFHKKNSGPGDSRKLGFEHATGDLIFFVDSDDWITSDKTLEKINTIFNNHEIDILFFDREDIVDSKKNIIRGFDYLEEGFYEINAITGIVRPGLGCKIFKKNLLKEDMFIGSKIFEDLYTTYKYLDKCKNFYYKKESYYTIYHEKNSISLSSNINADMICDAIKILNMLFDTISNKNFTDGINERLIDIFWLYIKSKNKNKVNNLLKKEIKKAANMLKKDKKKYIGKKKIKKIIIDLYLRMNKEV